MKCILVLLLFSFSSMGFSQNWKTNFEEAKIEATSKNENILVFFSGSDWCAPCIKLDKNILESAVFKNYAEELILVRADFVKKKQNQLSEEQRKLNERLAEQYNPEGIFPLVILLDHSGKILGKTSYKNVSPEEYVKLLQSFIK